MLLFIVATKFCSHAVLLMCEMFLKHLRYAAPAPRIGIWLLKLVLRGTKQNGQNVQNKNTLYTTHLFRQWVGLKRATLTVMFITL